MPFFVFVFDWPFGLSKKILFIFIFILSGENPEWWSPKSQDERNEKKIEIQGCAKKGTNLVYVKSEKHTQK